MLDSGIVGGIVGTAAMTVSSSTEAKVTGREASTMPTEAAGKVAGVQPGDEQGVQRFNTLAHWGYGTVWGVFRGLLEASGLRGPRASLVRFVAVLGTEQAILPALGVGSPAFVTAPRRPGSTASITPSMRAVTGAVYDRLRA
ncbi:MAG: hypothetical protein ACRDRV_17330 [Pseudonocardiaceae bacterium]